MRSTSESTMAHSGRFLSVDELALPAVCGQTGKPFLMVARWRGPGALELVRVIAMGPAPSVCGVPVPRERSGPRMRSPAPNRAAVEGRPEDAAVSCQTLKMSVRIHIGRLYDGCPYCRASGYFHCSDCAMFSCWNRYNARPHFHHTDVWCEACQSWKCTSDEDEGDNSATELTAFAERMNTVDLPSRIAPGSTAPHQIDRSTSIRAYLK